MTIMIRLLQDIQGYFSLRADVFLSVHMSARRTINITLYIDKWLFHILDFRQKVPENKTLQNL